MTVSDINTDARDALARFFETHWWDANESVCDCGSPFVHSEHLAEVLTQPEVFGRLAGLLGYVKADHEEWGVRYQNGVIDAGLTSQEYARLWARAESGSSGQLEVVRRYRTPWEVVVDASE